MCRNDARFRKLLKFKRMYENNLFAPVIIRVMTNGKSGGFSFLKM